MKRSLLVCFLLSLGLAGCATGWSKKKCETTNWQQLGYSEGSFGKVNSSNAYSATCSKKGAVIDIKGYNSGHNSGMKVFCSSNNGYETAIEGNNPVNKCLQYPAYAKAYAKGQKDFCTVKNGTRLGEKGLPFPEKCERAGRAFERAFNRGRLGYLEEALKEKELNIISARRDYERVRDDLQDMQFELGRMPRYSTDDTLLSRKRSLESRIARTRGERDKLRETVDGMDRDLNEMRREISYLRKRT